MHKLIPDGRYLINVRYLHRKGKSVRFYFLILVYLSFIFLHLKKINYVRTSECAVADSV